MQDEERKTPPDAGWEFKEDGVSQQSTDDGELPVPEPEMVAWTASEYVAHDKDPTWFLIAGGVTVAFATLVFFVLAKGSWFSALMVLIGGGVFIASAARPPKVAKYSISHDGLQIGSKLYPFAKFKTFSIIDEGVLHSITLMPLERFMPPLSVYFDPADEAKISDTLSAYLPYEARELAPVDRLMRKIRF